MIKMFAFFIFVSILIGILAAMFQGSQAGVSTVLASDLSDTEDTVIGVTSITGFKSASIVIINNEIIRYSGTAEAGSCPAGVSVLVPCFTGLTRSVGETAAVSHLAGARVYDQELGISNLQAQHSYSTFQSELEGGSNISLNPFTWKDAMTSRVANFVPTFLTGNWAYINMIFIFFISLFIIVIALVMISAIRGVRLF